MARCFVSYSTANDGDYFADFMNLSRFSRRISGVGNVRMYIAVSEVRRKRPIDELILQELTKIAVKNSKITVISASFKSNIGRDFSSAAHNLRQIALEAEADDVVLFINRSGYGPYDDNWFLQYLDLLQKGADLVGTTLNVRGHPRGKQVRDSYVHVQTYCYAAKMRDLQPMLEEFPAEFLTDRTQLIEEGEIGLSQHIYERGGRLASLAHPDIIVSRDSPSLEGLPSSDEKANIYGFPFLYKRALNRQILGRIAFFFWMMSVRQRKAAE